MNLLLFDLQVVVEEAVSGVAVEMAAVEVEEDSAAEEAVVEEGLGVVEDAVAAGDAAVVEVVG